MPYSIVTLPEFDKNVKKLAKRYKNIKNDLSSLASELKNNPKSGTYLFNNCYKIKACKLKRSYW